MSKSEYMDQEKEIKEDPHQNVEWDLVSLLLNVDFSNPNNLGLCKKTIYINPNQFKNVYLKHIMSSIYRCAKCGLSTTLPHIKENLLIPIPPELWQQIWMNWIHPESLNALLVTTAKKWIDL